LWIRLTQYKISRLVGEQQHLMLSSNLVDVVRIKIDAGASDIDILIPDSVGCEINSDAALSSRNYEGFTKIDDRSDFNKYQRKFI
jgi:hypothetical protein